MESHRHDKSKDNLTGAESKEDPDQISIQDPLDRIFEEAGELANDASPLGYQKHISGIILKNPAHANEIRLFCLQKIIAAFKDAEIERMASYLDEMLFLTKKTKQEFFQWFLNNNNKIPLEFIKRIQKMFADDVEQKEQPTTFCKPSSPGDYENAVHYFFQSFKRVETLENPVLFDLREQAQGDPGSAPSTPRSNISN